MPYDKYTYNLGSGSVSFIQPRQTDPRYTNYGGGISVKYKNHNILVYFHNSFVYNILDENDNRLRPSNIAENPNMVINHLFYEYGNPSSLLLVKKEDGTYKLIARHPGQEDDIIDPLPNEYANRIIHIGEKAYIPERPVDLNRNYVHTEVAAIEGGRRRKARKTRKSRKARKARKSRKA